MYARWGKRIFDLLSAMALAVVTAPVHVLCAAGVRLTSGKPVYFTQERAGRNGQPFRLIKFRTMAVGTHERTGGYPAAGTVTPIGRVLRKTSLDELPQLMNIVKGDMSVVGPRPALVEQARRYSESQRGRLSVRPGLTGLAQIRFRNSAPWSVRIQSDLEYVGSVSFWGDMLIVLKTIPSVLRGDGMIIGQSTADVDDLGPSVVEPSIDD